MGEKRKYSQAHWEMVAWLHNHDVSLDDKYDLKNAPHHPQKKNKRRETSGEPEDTLDLHGLTVEEAAKEIKSFVLSCKLKGYYIVKIIHGKGLHSPGEAKLKRLVEEYLNGDGKKMISSWKLAPHNMGGDGAVLIYL